jgi:hypothetical protein
MFSFYVSKQEKNRNEEDIKKINVSCEQTRKERQ